MTEAFSQQPNDLVKQSMPFSYLAVSLASNDGGSHSVKLYTDISAEWVSGDRSQSANWTTTSGSVVSHKIQLVNQTTYVEAKDQIQRKIILAHTISLFSRLTRCRGRDILFNRWRQY